MTHAISRAEWFLAGYFTGVLITVLMIVVAILIIAAKRSR